MAKFNINTFRAALSNDGARPTQFRVLLWAPAVVGLPSSQLSFMAEATSLPNLSVTPIEVPYWGRRIKIAGDRTVGNWSIQVINDESFDLRGAFERWSASIATISTRSGRQRGLGATSNPNSYTGYGIVEHYGKEGDVLRTYKMTSVWPMDVSGIDLSWGAESQIERFSVTFCMDWWELVTAENPLDIAAVAQ